MTNVAAMNRVISRATLMGLEISIFGMNGYNDTLFIEISARASGTRMRAVRCVVSVASVQHGYSRLLHKQANCGTIFDDFLTYLC